MNLFERAEKIKAQKKLDQEKSQENATALQESLDTSSAPSAPDGKPLFQRPRSPEAFFPTDLFDQTGAQRQ